MMGKIARLSRRPRPPLPWAILLFLPAFDPHLANPRGVGNQRVSGRRPRPKSWLWPSMRLLSLVIWLMRSFFDATLWALEEAA
jgi:hypothetical protein